MIEQERLDGIKKIKKGICPECGKKLKIINNIKMDDSIEKIHICSICKRAFRIE